MKPQNDQSITRVGALTTDQPRSPIVAAPRPTATTPPSNAAADVVRSQLNHIYSGGSDQQTPHTTPIVKPTAPLQTEAEPKVEPAPEPDHSANLDHGFNTAPPRVESPTKEDSGNLSGDLSTMYQRSAASAVRQPSKEDWQQYHTAWQTYYQMYYERQSAIQKANSATATNQQSAQENTAIGSSETTESINQKQAMEELRSSIRSKVSESADKVRKSRHFIPAIAGFAVFMVFVVIQFNRPIVGMVMAYTAPGSIEPENIIVDPTTEVDVGPEPKMIIPKINIDAPVVYGIGPDYNSQMAAMEKGIAHFAIAGANAVPGQIGNAVFAAHSSNDAFARGDYKFIFAKNEKLVKGDLIYMNYEGKRYTYSVTTTEVVMPNEVSKVQIQTDKPMLTLISCVPLGTAEKRLLVFAEQISPNPSGADTAETSDTSTPEATNIPGQPSPTLLEKLFGAR